MKKLLYFIALLILVGIGGYMYFNNWYSTGIEQRLSSSSDTVKFTVETGEGTDSIATNLEDRGLIDSGFLFKLYLKRSGRGTEIQAGEFEIPKNSNIIEIVDILGNAVSLDSVKVTVIEGYRNAQVADLLEDKFSGVEESKFSKTEFNTIVNSPDNVTFSPSIQTFLDAYKPTGKKLEGFLYPDTYEFETDATTLFVIEKMISNFMDKTASIEKGEDFYDQLIIASIVERESFTNEERDEIASVFYNRLEIGMALESDATVNYATGVDNPQTTNEERQIDSPYNTYMYPGLTPTPINNPRIESIEAAVKPATTSYYFFLHEQDGSGQVHFAETLYEHNQNRALYLD